MQGLLRAGEPPDTHRPVPQALLRVPLENPTKVPDPNKAACTKRDRQSRARNQLQPPVYGVPKGFAADPQHLILINQQIVSSGLWRRDKCNSESVKHGVLV